MANVAVWKISLNGTLNLDPVVLTPVPETLDAASRRIPGGAYTTFRTFDFKKALHLDDHIRRLGQTARLANIPVHVDESAVREALRQVLVLRPGQEKRVRLTLDLEQHPGTIYIEMEPLKVPSEQDYRQGVRVVTRSLERANPKAKLTSFINKADAVRKELPRNVNEALMVGEDRRILEGLSSNFFAVRNAEIWTAEEGVLSGITRSLVIEEAQKARIPVHLEAIRAEELDELNEAFITSSSRAVLPVVEINDQPVGSGQPGPVTKLLLERYQDRIEQEIEPV